MIGEATSAEIFTPEIKELGERLLHHQCWFFGQDIRHESGNLLIRFGFERFGVPSEKSGSNNYRFRSTDDTEINLWGWGVFFGNEKGGILIKRYDFCPRLLKVGKLYFPVFKSENLPLNRMPRENLEIRTARKITAQFIEWVLEYETWIEGECGKYWRRKNLREWERAEFPARNIRRNWQSLRNKIKKL